MWSLSSKKRRIILCPFLRFRACSPTGILEKFKIAGNVSIPQKGRKKWWTTSWSLFKNPHPCFTGKISMSTIFQKSFQQEFWGIARKTKACSDTLEHNGKQTTSLQKRCWKKSATYPKLNEISSLFKHISWQPFWSFADSGAWSFWAVRGMAANTLWTLAMDSPTITQDRGLWREN